MKARLPRSYEDLPEGERRKIDKVAYQMCFGIWDEIADAYDRRFRLMVIALLKSQGHNEKYIDSKLLLLQQLSRMYPVGASGADDGDRHIQAQNRNLEAWLRGQYHVDLSKLENYTPAPTKKKEK